MTKKDYELIAGVVKDFDQRLGNWFNGQERQQRQEVHAELAHSMANQLEQDNPKFDRNKFLQACGIETAQHLRTYEVVEGRLGKRLD